jgi:galactoside O-acetyltransferase
MLYANISLGENIQIDPTSSINNICIGDNVKIAKNVSAYGSPENILEIGSGTYIGMNCILNGYSAKLTIGENVSFAQNVNVMVDSGPNASSVLQCLFPLMAKAVVIGDHSWIGASTIIMPGVILGKFCVVGAGSFVTASFPDYSIIGGTPAKLIRKFTDEEIEKLML